MGSNARRLPYIYSIGTQKPYFGSKGGPGFHLMSVCVVVGLLEREEHKAYCPRLIQKLWQNIRKIRMYKNEWTFRGINHQFQSV